MIDSNQFTTIVITAVVTAIAKPLGSWLVDLVKNTAATKTITAKLRAIFTISNFRIAYDIFGLLVISMWLTYFGIDDKPLTRIVVLQMIGFAFLLLFAVWLLYEDIKVAAKERKAKIASALPPPAT